MQQHLDSVCKKFEADRQKFTSVTHQFQYDTFRRLQVAHNLSNLTKYKIQYLSLYIKNSYFFLAFCTTANHSELISV